VNSQQLKKKVEPFTVSCSREKLSKLEKDPNQPPPLGIYNPKPVKLNSRVWRVYELERDVQDEVGKSEPLTYSRFLSGLKGGKS